MAQPGHEQRPESARSEAHTELEISRMLLQAFDVLARQTESEQALGTLADLLSRATAHQRIVIQLWDPEARQLKIEIVRGASVPETGQIINYESMSSHIRRVIDTRESSLIDYDRLPPSEKTIADSMGSRLTLFAPIATGVRLLGILSLDDYMERREFSPSDIRIVEAIADQAAVAVDRARLLEQTTRARQAANRELELTRLLLQAARSISEWTSLQQVSSQLAQIIIDATAHSRASICRWHEGGRALEVLASVGRMPVPAGASWPYEQLSITARNAINERRIGTWDLRELPQQQRGTAGQEYQGQLTLFVPLLSRQQLVGLIVLDSPGERREFSEREISLVQAIGSQAAVTMENAALFDSTKAELARTELLQAVALAATTQPEMPLMADAVLQSLRQFLQLKAGGIRAVEGNRLRLVSSFNYTEEQLELIDTVSLDSQNMMGARALREKRVLTHEDEIMNEERKQILGRLAMLEDRYAFIPIGYRGIPLGMLSLTFAGKRSFTEDELELFTSISQVIGQAMKNVQLFDAERERSERIQALHDIMEVGLSSLKLEEAGQRVIEYLVERLALGSAGLWLADSDRLNLIATANVPESWKHKISAMPLSGGSAMAKVFKSGEPVIMPHAGGAEAWWKATRGTETGMTGAASYVMLPLRGRSMTIGVLALAWTSRHKPEPEDLSFYSSIANSVGVILENIRLYTREHRIAETLQQALLSLPDHLAGIDFAYEYMPAQEEARIGGDFYDLFEFGPGRLGITVCDIAGKGLEAAILIAMVKNAIRAQATEPGKRPSQVMSTVNRLIEQNNVPEAFATVFFGVLDRTTGELAYCNAGHTSGFILKPDGGVEMLEANSALVGAFADVSFSDSAATMEPGDILFLYTDGLTEAHRPGGRILGERRIMEVLERSAGRGIECVVNEAVTEAIDHAGGRLSDDLLILALSRKPSA